MASLAEWLKTLTPEQNQFVARLVASLPESEGGLGLPLQNTAMQRADILFPDEMYHGTGQESLEFLSPEGKNRTAGAGAFLTTNPINAETYVPGLGQSGNILPLRVNRKGLMEVNAKGRNWNDINTNDLFHKRKALVDIFPEDLSPNDVTTTDEIAQLAPYAGFEGVTIKNVKDQGPNSHVFRVKEYLQNKYGIKPTEEHTYWDQVSGKQLQEARNYVEKMYSSQKGDVTAIQNPARIRSKFAGFNPWRTNESNLLASHPLATALGSATLAKMLGAGQNIDLRQSINDKLSESADPLGLYSRYGMEAPYSYGDVAQQALGATDLYAPIAAGEAIEAAKKGEWKKSGLSALGALPIIGAIKASHGSPHAFTKFDFSKIGTGEGAQAYGHGGYFAQGFDSPTAKEYQKQLAADVQLKGQPFYSGKSGKQLATTGNPELDDYLMANLGDVGAARANLLADLRDVRSGGGDVKDYQRTLADLRNIRGDVENTDLGHLYNVELKWPDPAREAADPLGEHHLLDWDARLSEQPEYVRKAFEKADAKRGLLRNYSKILDPEDQWTRGGDAYSDLALALNDSVIKRGSTAIDDSHKVVSNYLRDLGIPGIRYLDQGSRATSGGDLIDVFKGPQGWHSKIKVTNRSGAGFSAPTDSFTTSMPFKTEQEARDWAASKIGAGTRNYVMFDDALANIVSRNGVSLSDLLRR